MLLNRSLSRWNQADPWERLAWTGWVVAVLVVCVRSALYPETRTVFPTYLSAGQHWQAGESLYDLKGPFHNAFRYSPLAAAFFTPFGMLSKPMANIAWRILGGALLAGGLLWWLKVVVPRPLTRSQTATIMVLTLPTVLPSLSHGQANLMLLGLIVAGVAACQSGWFSLAAVCISVACWLKIYPIALGLLLVLVYPRRFGIRFAIALVAGFLLPFAFQSWDYVVAQYSDWIQYLQIDDRETMPLDDWMRDVRLLFRVYAQPMSARAYLALELATAAICAGWCVAARWLWRLESRQILFVLTLLACCWMTVFGPATEPSAWILLGPCVASALVLDRMLQARWWQQGLVAVSYVLFVSTLMAKWFRWGKIVSNYGSQTIAGLLFFAWTIVFGLSLLKRSSQEPEETQDPKQFRAAA